MTYLVKKPSRTILITGGAGFIGANLASYLLGATDARILLYDNLSHPGSAQNLAWLCSQAAPGRLHSLPCDVDDAQRLGSAVAHADEIYHLAADCDADAHTGFGVNTSGAVNVLRAAAGSDRNPTVVYLSTAKVYTLRNLPVRGDDSRLIPIDPSFSGVSEAYPVDYEAPVSCGRGAADRAMQDFARVHGVRSVVLRLDTAVGPRQFGMARHGWVSWCVQAALEGRPFCMRGNGMQVHDLLHVADVVDALVAARAYIGVTAGKAYNIGGGAVQAMSVREVVNLVQRVCHRSMPIHLEPEEPAEIPFYIADARSFIGDTAWRPRRSIEQAVRDAAAFWQSMHNGLALLQTGNPAHQAQRAA